MTAQQRDQLLHRRSDALVAMVSGRDRADEAEAFDPTWGLPSAGELLMDGIEKIHSAASGYKHRRAERRARKEVQDALAAFCAVRECPGRVARQR